MAEYIDREALREKLCNIFDEHQHLNPEFSDGIDTAIRFVDDEPAADVAPVVHSRWLFADTNFNHNLRIAVKCANCDTVFRMGLTLDEAKDWKEANKFCKLCGAKMDEETAK